MRHHTRPPRTLPRRSRTRAVALLALAAAATSACASAPRQSTATGATSQTTRAFSTAVAQPSGTAHPAGTSIAVPGRIASPPTPTTLPCFNGSADLTLHADGTDPTQICMHHGTRLTVKLPALSIGPWQTPTLTDNHVVTVTATQANATLQLTAATTGATQISTQTNPGAAAGAPSRIWTATLTVIP